MADFDLAFHLRLINPVSSFSWITKLAHLASVASTKHLVVPRYPTAALSLFEEGLVIARKLVAAEPANTEFQTDIVESLYNLSTVQKGQARKESLGEGLAVLKMLDAAGKLSSVQKSRFKFFQE